MACDVNGGGTLLILIFLVTLPLWVLQWPYNFIVLTAAAENTELLFGARGIWYDAKHSLIPMSMTGVVEVEVVVGASVSGFCDVTWHGFSFLHRHLYGLQSSTQSPLHPHR